MRRPGRRWIGAWVLLVWLAAGAGCGRDGARQTEDPGQPPPMRLETGTPLEHQEREGEVLVFELGVEAHRLIDLVIDQDGVDVATTLYAPDGTRMLSVDRPIDRLGRERLLAVSGRAGTYRIEVEAADGAGRFTLRCAPTRVPDEADRRAVSAAATFSAAEDQRRAGKLDRAITLFSRALATWRSLNDAGWQAECLERLGRMAAYQDRLDAEIRLKREAATQAARAGDEAFESILRYQLGAALFRAARLDEALEQYHLVLARDEQIGDRSWRARVLHAIGQVHHVLREVQEAIDWYRQALAELGSPEADPVAFARTTHNLAILYHEMGDLDRAEELLVQAETLFEAAGRVRERATSLNQLGVVRDKQGDIDGAERLYRQALELRREAGDEPGQASSFIKLGQLLEEESRPDEALEHYRQALAITTRLKRPRSSAEVLLNLGSAYLAMGQPGEAEGVLAQARETLERIGDRFQLARSLLGLAKARRALGRLRAARDASAQSLEILESLRSEPASQKLRVSFFRDVQEHFDLHIELLMELDRTAPGEGFAEEALLTAERGRARSLVDQLREAGAGIRAGVDPALIEAERLIQRRLSYLEERRLRLLDDPEPAPGILSELERGVKQALRQLDEARARIRTAAGTADANGAAAGQLGLDLIRRTLLDPQTLLLEYRLSEHHSHLWVLSADGTTAYTLPPRDRIEKVATEAYELLIRSRFRDARAQAERAMCELADMILPPEPGRLGTSRLLIVADGMLRYIPFAALPAVFDGGTDEGDAGGALPCSSRKPLVVAHEITYAPSALAAVTAHTRPMPTGPAQAGRHGRLAVLADPVFSNADERIAQARSTSDRPTRLARLDEARPGPDAPTRAAGTTYQRLPSSSLEAQALLDMAPSGSSLAALGFDATKELVLSGRLRGYSIVHFATHGQLHEVHPELSGLVLSLVDREGRPIDGFLREHEVFSLSLPCDLVVLSACETALGPEISGEGIAGITRGFMHAGARQVMVSLWQVADRGTAELMTQLYRAMLVDGLPPPAALRQAQLAMWRDGRAPRSAPYFWAGFVVQGGFWDGPGGGHE